MRRLLAFGMMGLGLLAMAKTLTPEEAIQRVYANPGGQAKALSAVRMNVIKTFTHNSNEAMVYLFEGDRNTWMAVSANDLATPLLGYGDEVWSDGEIPPQMEWWLGQYAAQIAYADSANRIPTVGSKLNGNIAQGQINNATANKAPAKTDRATISMIMPTKWDQSSPYNKLCPKVGLQRTPTGCVATAISQIMKVHEYPENGIGSGYATVGTSSDRQTLDLNIPLRWSEMKNVYTTGSYTTDQANAVAELMQAVGYGCHMNYNIEGSGAYDKDACRSLIENFDYAVSTWLYMRDFFTLEEWEDMIYAELADGRPVYYSGRATDGGHAFVCDGYNGNGYFHFNWGWGGYYNGNFKIDALNPEGQGIGGYEGGYNTDQMAIMGIQPAFEGAKQPQPKMSCYVQPTVSFSGNILSIKGQWYNYGYKAEKFTFALEALNLDTGKAYYQTIGTYELQPYSGYVGFNIDMRSSSYADGNYQLQIVTKTTDYPEWTPCNGPTTVTKTVNCMRQEGQWLASAEVPLKVVYAEYPEAIDINVATSYTVTIENPNSKDITRNFEVLLCIKEGNSLTVVGNTDGEDIVEVTVPANSEYTVTQDFTIIYFDDEYQNAQNLLLVLIDNETLEVVYTFGNVKIGTQPNAIPITSLTIDPTEIEAKEGTQFQLTATILPEDATNPELIWNSSDEKIATVDQTGLVTVLKAGECTVIAATTDGSDLKAECRLMAVAGVDEILNEIGGIFIYTLDGVKTDCTVDHLSPGIYVVGNKKIVIR